MIMEDRNRQLILAYLETYERGDAQARRDMLSDDFQHWVCGEGRFALSGTRDKRAYFSDVAQVMGEKVQKLRMEVLNIICEGDQVCVETRGHATMADGRPYNNRYVFIYKISGGKIVSIREYLDTIYAQGVLVEGKNLGAA